MKDTNEQFEVEDDFFEVEEIDQEEGQENEEVKKVETQEPVEVDETAQFLLDVYKEHGIIDTDEEFDGTEEWVVSQLEKYPERVKQQIVESVPSEAKDFIELLLTKKDLTREDYIAYYNDFLSEKELDISTEDDAREFLEEKLKGQGLREKAIKAQLDDLEDEGLLMEEAKKFLNSSESKTKKTLNEVKQQQQEEEHRFQSFMQDVAKEIETFAKPRQEVIKKTIPNVNTIVGEIASNPAAYVALVDLLSYYKDGKFDLSVFKKQAQTEVTKSLKEKMQGRQISTTRTKEVINNKPTLDNFEILI